MHLELKQDPNILRMEEAATDAAPAAKLLRTEQSADVASGAVVEQPPTVQTGEESEELYGEDAAEPHSKRPGGKKRKVALFMAYLGAGYLVRQSRITFCFPSNSWPVYHECCAASSLCLTIHEPNGRKECALSALRRECSAIRG
jgi:hypothetical protein